MGDEVHPTTLYVGNLDMTVNEDFLLALFGTMGFVKSCKIIRESGNNPYAFVEFMNHPSAATALVAMNKRVFLGKELKVNWAISPANQPKVDTSNHHHIFVGDLSLEIETQALRNAFEPFGEISNCRIIRDPQTMKSKGYGFLSFVNKSEAENAIQMMNGQWLGGGKIRTNWSARKPPPPRESKPAKTQEKEGLQGMLKDYGYGGRSKMAATPAYSPHPYNSPPTAQAQQWPQANSSVSPSYTYWTGYAQNGQEYPATYQAYPVDYQSGRTFHWRQEYPASYDYRGAPMPQAYVEQ